MGIGKALVVALNILCGLYGGYFALIVIVGALRRPRPLPAAAPKKRIAAVIAARNEAAVIEGVVQTLLAQNYPRELFDVWVVPNNCTDDTERIARAAGAKILPCEVRVSSKGDVLRYAFSKLIERGDYDAFCLFDADNIVDPNFLSVSNAALVSGMRIAQGFRDSKNSRQSAIAGGMSVFYWFMSRLFNRARWQLGMSAMLNGTGVLISRDLIEEIGYDVSTLTEDLEYTAQCGIRGVQIGWMEDAITYDEQPFDLASSMTQRRRWFFGSVQCFLRYGPRLWGRVLRARSFQAFDFGIFFLGNLVQVLSLVPGIAGILQGVRYGLQRGVLLWMAAGAAGAALLFIVACSAFAALICTLVGRSPKRELPGVLGFWVILATWAPANLSALFLPPKWKPIPHGSPIDIPPECGMQGRRPEAVEKASGF